MNLDEFKISGNKKFDFKNFDPGAKKLKLDPAIMAAPLLSTILDTCSVLIFFNIAKAFLGL